MKIIKKYGLWILLLTLAIIFYIILKYVTRDCSNIFDDSIYSLISSLRCDKLTGIMKIITELGNFYVMIPIALIFLIFNKKERFSKYFAINLCVIWLFNLFIKLIVQRPRPLDINLIIESGYSFPSGHSMVSFAFYGFLIYYVMHLDWKKVYKYLLSFILALVVLLVGISRIYLGVHYATDVCGGFVVSLFYLILFIKLIYNKKEK